MLMSTAQKLLPSKCLLLFIVSENDNAFENAFVPLESSPSADMVIPSAFIFVLSLWYACSISSKVAGLMFYIPNFVYYVLHVVGISCAAHSTLNPKAFGLQRLTTYCTLISRFTQCLDQMQQRHSTVVETMARGVIEMKEQAAAAVSGSGGDTEVFVVHDVENRTQYFLDRFYMMRISIRLLIHQHRAYLAYCLLLGFLGFYVFGRT